MDKGYIERLKQELTEANKALDSIYPKRDKARKELQQVEQELALAHSRVDTVKNMLISALDQ